MVAYPEARSGAALGGCPAGPEGLAASSAVCGMARAGRGVRRGQEEQEDEEEEDSDQERIMIDVQRVPRGRCRTCEGCPLWQKAKGAFAHLTCGRCQCKTADHEDLTFWMKEVLDRCSTTAQTYLSEGIPVDAYEKWSKLDILFYLETGTAFRPGRHGRPAIGRAVSSSSNSSSFSPAHRRGAASSSGAGSSCSSTARPGASSAQPGGGPGKKPLCSIICPTTHERHAFHPMLYHCYTNQSYRPRELIVIDTGRHPSKYLQDRAKRDPNLVYRWFEGGRCWSLGLKRNLACYLARGEIIAHFDDDDLYARDYLARMVDEIQQAAAARPAPAEGDGEAAAAEDQSKEDDDSGPTGPLVAATLAAWYVFDAKKRSFRTLRAVSDQWVYGWGFSFVYTREAWRCNFFPHMGIGEDFEFMMALRKLPDAQVLTLEDFSAVCSHTNHPDLSISGGERRRGGPGVEEVQPPQALVGMLPMLLAANNQCLWDNGKREAIPEDEHSYFLLGSWSEWTRFDELRPGAKGSAYSARIGLNGSAQTIEFQVFANRDWSMCYYPSPKGAVVGPWRSPGAHWVVQVPKGCGQLHVAWDPSGDRSLQWSLDARTAAPGPAAPQRGAAQQEPVVVRVPEWGRAPVHLFGSICSAMYGAGDRWADVRGCVERALSKGRELVVRNDSLGGDPCPGCPKFLVVAYMPRG